MLTFPSGSQPAVIPAHFAEVRVLTRRLRLTFQMHRRLQQRLLRQKPLRSPLPLCFDQSLSPS